MLKQSKVFWGIIGILFGAVFIWAFVYFAFFTSDDFQDAVISKITFAIGKFVVLPFVTLLIICYCLNITERDLTKGDKSFTVWAKMGMSIFVLLCIPASPPFGMRSLAFFVFSFLAFLKINKGEMAYA